MSLDDEINKAIEGDEEDPVDQESDEEQGEEFDERESEEQTPNRAQRRQMEKDQRKQDKRQLVEPTRPRQVDQSPKQRRPQSSVVSKPISRYREIDSPSVQSVPPGTGNTFVQSRMQQVLNTGELAGKNQQFVADEYAKVQQELNAFIVWQANREDYVVYQYSGYNEEIQKDDWAPQKYVFNPLTMGQYRRLQKVLATYNDLVRARDNNDRSVQDVNSQVDRASINIWKCKAELYFRMYIGRYFHKDTNEEVDEDDENGILEVEDEFEKTNHKDLDLAIQAYEWASQNLSQWKRGRSYAKSSSVTNSMRKMR